MARDRAVSLGRRRVRPHGSAEPLVGFVQDTRQSDLDWQPLVRDKVHEIGVELTDAMSANDRHDWAAMLKSARMLQGRATIMRAAPEHALGPHPVDPVLPPLVRVV